MTFITVEGEQLLAQKQGAQEILTIDRVIFANIDGLGDEPADRVETVPSAADIVSDTAPTQQGYINPNQVVYSIHLDTNIGDFDYNWIGIASGDVLIAASHLPATQTKTATVGSTTGNNLTRNFLLAYSGVQEITGITVEASTWQIDFTARLWDMDERQRLHMLDLYGRQMFFKSGWQLIKTGTEHNLQAGLGMVAGLRIEREAILPVTVAAVPSSVWLDVSQQGDLNGLTETVSVIVSATAQDDYIDSNQRPHYLVKIADISAAGIVTDTRTVYDVSSNVLAFLTRQATTDYPGISELATTAEGKTGTDNKRTITSAVLKAVLDTLIPPGIVVMWSGATNAVPSGWALCDGNSGRPDLRDRFVVGAGSGYVVGATGGADTKNTTTNGSHTHAINAAGSHSHAITVDGHTLLPSEMPRHTHSGFNNYSFFIWTQDGSGGALVGGGASNPNIGSAGLTAPEGGGLPHYHSAGSNDAGSHTHSENTGGDHLHSVDVRPKYFALAYIIKL